MRRLRAKSRKQRKHRAPNAGKRRSLAELKRNIKRAQKLVRKYIKPGVSLVDELIAERREAARHE
ncbi:MAG TPA: hypothetical protein VKT53_14865 [Candidatus Acidoferrum sp.]|nr:hypothetical protein [Candidatus Acidoferrum sp.]